MAATVLPIELINATKRYGENTVVDGFSFHAEPGELVALLGPNGAGKTTSISMMLGLKAMTSGTARVFGEAPASPAARERSAIMLQESGLPGTLKVREIVELFSRLYPNPISTQSAIEAAMLEHKLDDRIAGLSGGEQQRLYFALAIVGDPDLLFLDEPTVGMDVTAREVFWDRIRAMHARGKTIVLTTHYLEEADALAERIVVINRGREIANGTPQQIKASASGKVIRFRSLEASADLLRAFPDVDRVTVTGDRVELYSRQPERSLKALLNSDVPVADLELTGASLEQAFVALTRDHAA
jgi:ABC-2 type transport system ATP-binding protein